MGYIVVAPILLAAVFGVVDVYKKSKMKPKPKELDPGLDEDYMDRQP